MDYRSISRRSAGASILAAATAAKLAVAHPKRIDNRDAKTLTPDLQSFMDGFAPERIVGVTLAVDGRANRWVGTAGYSNLQTRTPISASDAIPIGSITKTFVAVVAMQLQESGKLLLDAASTKYLGDQALKAVANIEKASLAQLMGHTSGIPSPEDDSLWIRDARGAGINPAKIWSPTDSLEYIFGKPALSAPGGAYNYSNSNYTILGLIIQTITGNTLWHEITKRITGPLGLSNTYMDGISTPASATRLASLYHYATPHFAQAAGISKTFTEVRDGLIDVSRTNFSCEWGDGNIISTAPDVALFFSALRSGKLVRPASLDFMTTWRKAGAMGPGQYFYVGHGLFRQFSGAHSIVGHTGGVLGATANVFWIEGTPITYAGLSNVGVEDIGEQKTSVNSLAQNPEFIRMLSNLDRAHP